MSPRQDRGHPVLFVLAVWLAGAGFWHHEAGLGLIFGAVALWLLLR